MRRLRLKCIGLLWLTYRHSLWISSLCLTMTMCHHHTSCMQTCSPWLREDRQGNCSLKENFQATSRLSRCHELRQPDSAVVLAQLPIPSEIFGFPHDLHPEMASRPATIATCPERCVADVNPEIWRRDSQKSFFENLDSIVQNTRHFPHGLFPCLIEWSDLRKD